MTVKMAWDWAIKECTLCCKFFTAIERCKVEILDQTLWLHLGWLLVHILFQLWSELLILKKGTMCFPFAHFQWNSPKEISFCSESDNCWLLSTRMLLWTMTRPTWSILSHGVFHSSDSVFIELQAEKWIHLSSENRERGAYKFINLIVKSLRPCSHNTNCSLGTSHFDL